MTFSEFLQKELKNYFKVWADNNSEIALSIGFTCVFCYLGYFTTRFIIVGLKAVSGTMKFTIFPRIGEFGFNFGLFFILLSIVNYVLYIIIKYNKEKQS